MARITVQALSTAGLTPSFTAASSGGDEFLNDGHTILIVRTTAAATNAANIASRVTPVPKGLAVANVAVEVSALGERMSGFFDQGAYNDSSGCAAISYTTHTGLSVAAISVT